jgi:ribosomal protein S28E/S33
VRRSQRTQGLVIEVHGSTTVDGEVVGLRVRVEGMTEEVFQAMVRDGQCPLCCQRQHSLEECPLLPNELRPFC